ncbi:MAG TPA: pseudouridine synthase [Terracidiphilus sp.]|nr:pseudouridine synthase [Terracidiphilus sp.]
MRDESAHEHEADGPEQEIVSDAHELLRQQANAEADAEDPERHETEAPESEPRPVRLQKILAQAGIASRRHAEELITGGRVQVNGQTITQLGAKADPARDHIRVDGKLLHGAERLRYFMLHKPKGYVTTVSDPEGRPTVMEFFARMGERLYPVGRLDYLSEGLLLVTNDGELANALTKAASGVEKTYLVKVSGQPTDESLDRLRGGVSIERGRPGEGKVRTAPARIRQVREGDNPWFEVVLIEGRNRELRKMFEEIGHRVEKIRRVGYGPLVLDLPVGKLRELDPGELEALRLTAAGKLKPRRLKTKKMLPKDAGKPVSHEETKDKPRRDRPFGKNPRKGESGGSREAGTRPREGRFGRADGGRTGNRRDDRGFRPDNAERAPFRPRPERRPFEAAGGEGRPEQSPRFNKPGKPFGGKPEGGRARSFGEKPAFRKPFREKPAFEKSFEDRPPRGKSFNDRPPRAKPFGKRGTSPEEKPMGRPPRREGSASAFRGKPKPGFKSDSKPGFKSGSKPGFGVRSGPGTKPGFGGKPKPGFGGRSGLGGPRRSSGPSQGRGGFKKGGPRPGGGRGR